MLVRNAERQERDNARLPAEAKQLLSDAGVSGLTLKITGANIPELVKMSEVLADQLRKVGIESEIVSVPFGELYGIQASGDFDITNSGASVMANDPDEIFGDFTTGAPRNLSRFGNPEVDRLVPVQSSEPDLQKRIDIVQDIEELILSDFVVIPQGAGSFGTAFWPWVKGFVKQDPFYSSYLRMERVWLDESLRK